MSEKEKERLMEEMFDLISRRQCLVGDERNAINERIEEIRSLLNSK